MRFEDEKDYIMRMIKVNGQCTIFHFARQAICIRG